MCNSPVLIVKAFAKIKNISPCKVFHAIYDEKIRRRWENVLSDFKTIHTIDEDVDIVYSSFSVIIISDFTTIYDHSK
jgi:hypothetical protein